MATQLKLWDSSAHEPTNRVEFANSLRGLACLSVVFAHYAGVFWEAPLAVSSLTGMSAYEIPADRMPAINWFENTIPNLQWGPLGVAIFFLISGFVIPYSIQRNTAFQFMINRVLRIWPTYVCGFALTAAMVALGSWSCGLRPPYNLKEFLIHTIPGIRDIVGSRNIDGIVWTLEIEVKFYALCALSAPWIRKASNKTFLVPIAISVISLFACGYIAVLPASLTGLTTAAINASQYLVFMFIGVAFHYRYVGKMEAKQGLTWVVTLGLLTCLIWSNSPYKSTFPIAWSYAFAVCAFAWVMNAPNLLRSNRVLDFVAAISYPLYVVHGVAGYVLMRWMFDRGVPPHLNIFLTVVAATIVAYALHITVEVPSQKFAKRLLSTRNHQQLDAPMIGYANTSSPVGLSDRKQSLLG